MLFRSEDIQVFAPVYRGPLGIDALDARLRDALDPDGRPVLGGRLRLGDKLMLSGRNLHDLGLMNGTILRLIAVGEDYLTVTADGLTIDLPDEEAPRLQLAYACSIHKASPSRTRDPTGGWPQCPERDRQSVV